jgi:hypothetical protein
MQDFSSLYCKIFKLRSNFWRTHVKNFSDNLLAVKFLTLFGTSTFLNKVQGLRQAGRGPARRSSRSPTLVDAVEIAFRTSHIQ